MSSIRKVAVGTVAVAGIAALVCVGAVAASAIPTTADETRANLSRATTSVEQAVVELPALPEPCLEPPAPVVNSVHFESAGEDGMILSFVDPTGTQGTVREVIPPTGWDPATATADERILVGVDHFPEDGIDLGSDAPDFDGQIMAWSENPWAIQVTAPCFTAAQQGWSVGVDFPVEDSLP